MRGCRHFRVSCIANHRRLKVANFPVSRGRFRLSFNSPEGRMKASKTITAMSVAALFCVSLALASAPKGGYHLLTKYSLGAAPGGKEYWDYITFDSASRLLYVSHNTEVKVVNADTGKVSGSVADLKRVHGIALIPHLGKGYISDGGADEVVVF